MLVGSSKNFRDWLVGSGVALSGNALQIVGSARRLCISLPERYQRHIVVIDAVLEPVASPVFRGAALYAAESWVWGEEATPMMFNRLRSCALGRIAEVNGEPFTAFGPEEYDDFYALTLLATLGRWDAWVVARGQPYVIDISHHGFFDVETSEAPVYDRLAARLKAAGFSFDVVE